MEISKEFDSTLLHKNRKSQGPTLWKISWNFIFCRVRIRSFLMAWVSGMWLLQEPDHRTQPAEFRHWNRESGCWCWWWCTGHFWPSSISFVNLFSHCSCFFWRKFSFVEKSSSCAAVKAVLVNFYRHVWMMPDVTHALVTRERHAHRVEREREAETEKTKKVESREKGMGSIR